MHTFTFLMNIFSSYTLQSINKKYTNVGQISRLDTFEHVTKRRTAVKIHL